MLYVVHQKGQCKSTGAKAAHKMLAKWALVSFPFMKEPLYVRRASNACHQIERAFLIAGFYMNKICWVFLWWEAKVRFLFEILKLWNSAFRCRNFSRGGARETRGQFHQHSTCRFYTRKSQKCKKAVWLDSLFALLVSEGVKVALRMLVKLNPNGI